MSATRSGRHPGGPRSRRPVDQRAVDPPLGLPSVEDIDAFPIEAMPAVVASLAALQARAAARLALSTRPRDSGENKLSPAQEGAQLLAMAE
jgi:hypothetical protein